VRLRIICFIFNFYSISAVAGYDCILKLSHVDSVDRVKVTEVLTMERGVRYGTAGKLGQLYSIEAYTNAQVAEEEIELSISDSKDGHVVSEKIALKGNSKAVTFFDSYQLVSSCEIRA
jgi:hypothetical protein